MAEHMHRGPPNMHSGCSSNLAPDVTGRIFDLKTLFHLNRILAPTVAIVANMVKVTASTLW